MNKQELLDKIQDLIDAEDRKLKLLGETNVVEQIAINGKINGLLNAKLWVYELD